MASTYINIPNQVKLTITSIEIGTVDQGAPNTLANAWPVKPTDGVNYQEFTALNEAEVVVTQPLPAGTNNIGSLTNITGVISLPTGAATEATLAAASAKLPSPIGAHVIAASMAVNIASDQTVPISVASLPLPIGASTSANQLTEIASLASIDAKLPSPLGAHLTAASLAINIASDQIVPISASSLPLPSGAATEATLSAMSAKLPSPIGAHVTSASMAVNIASDQTVPVSAASLPLPSGAATSANQTTEIASLSSIDGKMNSLGQKAMTASMPVVIASDQSAVPISAAALPLPSGAATSALQTTANTSLSSIDTKLTAPLSVTPTQKTAGYLRYGDVLTASTASAAIRRSNLFNGLTANTSLVISSNSVNDTAAGTGARQVRVTYYQATGAGPFTFDATMNGTTIVGLPALAFVERMEVISTGSSMTNEGAIFISLLAPLTNICTMNAGDKETFFCHHFVPLNKTTYITGFFFTHTGTAAANGGQFVIKYQTIPLASHAEVSVGVFHLIGTAGTQSVDFLTPVPIVGPAYILAYIVPDAATSNTYRAGLNFYDI